MRRVGKQRDARTHELVRLLGRGEPEEVCAAAIVLGALRPPGLEASHALVKRFHVASNTLRPYLLDALARQRTQPGLRLLGDLLMSHGPLRDQSMRLMADIGTRALTELDHVLETSSGENETAVFRVAAMMANVRGIQWLVRRMSEGSFQRARLACLSLRHELPSYPPALRRRVRDELTAVIARRKPRPRATALIAALKIQRLLAGPTIARPILELLDESSAPAVRSHALGVLQAIRIPFALRQRLRGRLEPLLFDGDVNRVAMPAFLLLRRQRPSLLDARLLARLESEGAQALRDEAVRLTRPA